MTNFAKARAEVEAMPNEFVAVAKKQLVELLDKAERGEQAAYRLNQINMISSMHLGDAKAAA